MKLIDQSRSKATDSPIKKLQIAIDGILAKGFDWDVDLKAQELVAKHLSRLLDSKYTLLRNLRLSVEEDAFPLILVGPPGLLVINPKGIKGVFQAKSENWLELDRRTKQYQTASHNLITESLDLAKKLDAFFEKGERQYPQSQPVLFLAHPGVHVDTNRPAVRIVRVDGIDRFGSTLPQSEAVLDSVQAQAAVDRLAGAFEASQKDKMEQMLKEQEQRLEKETAAHPARPAQRINLDRTRIILLGAMGVAEILLLVAFAVIVLVSMR